MNAWNVLVDGEIVDTVYYTKSCSAVYVKNSLVLFEDYPAETHVEQAE